MPDTQNFSTIVIGGGPGGYVCAIRLSQLGLKVALVEERETIGGTCINIGCIPSKALLDSSHKYFDIKNNLTEHGIKIAKLEFDLSKMMQRKTKIIKELTDGLDYLIKKNKITRFKGKGVFEKNINNEVTISVIEKGVEKEKISAKNCVIATGSKIIELPNVIVDGKTIINSDHALSLDEIPKTLTIIGGGVIGLELGSVWSRLGAEVTIVEALPNILLSLDNQMRDQVMRSFNKQGLKFLLGHKLLTSKSNNKNVQITLQNEKGDEVKLTSDKLLIAVGRAPNTDGLNCEKAGVEINERGRIKVKQENLQTTAPNIFAIGDVIEGPMLAHKASEEGVMVAEILVGKYHKVNYKALPWIIYTAPEIAWVGQTEDELIKNKIEYNVGKFLFRANARAKSMNETEGMIKIFASKKDDTILGVFIFGPNASELIAEATLAIEFKASSEDLAKTFHGHPTLSEVLHEAAMDVLGNVLHA